MWCSGKRRLYPRSRVNLDPSVCIIELESGILQLSDAKNIILETGYLILIEDIGGIALTDSINHCKVLLRILNAQRLDFSGSGGSFGGGRSGSGDGSFSGSSRRFRNNRLRETQSVMHPAQFFKLVRLNGARGGFVPEIVQADYVNQRDSGSFLISHVGLQSYVWDLGFIRSTTGHGRRDPNRPGRRASGVDAGEGSGGVGERVGRVTADSGRFFIKKAHVGARPAGYQGFT